MSALFLESSYLWYLHVQVFNSKRRPIGMLCKSAYDDKLKFLTYLITYLLTYLSFLIYSGSVDIWDHTVSKY